MQTSKHSNENENACPKNFHNNANNNDLCEYMSPPLSKQELIDIISFDNSSSNLKTGIYGLEMEMRILDFLDEKGIEVKSPLEKEYDYYDRRRKLAEKVVEVEKKLQLLSRNDKKKKISLPVHSCFKKPTNH